MWIKCGISGENGKKMRARGNKNRDLKSKLSGCSIGTSRTEKIEQDQNESRV